MPRRPITRNEGEMLIALAYAMSQEMDDAGFERAVKRWGEMENELRQRRVPRVDLTS